MSGPKEPLVAGSSSSGRAVRRFRPLVLLAVASLVATACNAGASASPPPASGGASASASAAVSASPSVDPLAPYPSKSGTLPLVKFIQAVPTMLYSSTLVAVAMNFFEYQGVKLQFVTLESSATSIQAITSGTVDLDNDGSTTLASAVAKGLDLQAIQNTAMMTLQVCVGKDWAQQHNVTASSPLAGKVAALKGATIGITAPGAAGDQVGRFLLTKYGKLNPDTDTQIITASGNSALPGALDANKIQAFISSPPACGNAKNGMVLVQPAEVPEFQNFTFGVVVGSKKWLVAHKDLATAVATAISMGSNFILKYPDAALKLVQKNFSAVDPQVIADGFNQTIKPAIRPDGKFAASMWQSTGQLLLDAGLIKQQVDTTEGSIWTNEYIGDASVR